MSAATTPTPWEAAGHCIRTPFVPGTGPGWLVAECQIGGMPGAANAAHIVRCVNAHESLRYAVAYMLRRMQQDRRMAWLIGPGSEAYEVLTAAAAAAQGQDVAALREQLGTTLQTVQVFTIEQIARRMDLATADAARLLGEGE